MGYPLPCSGQEKSMNCLVHGVTESDATLTFRCSGHTAILCRALGMALL